MLYLTLTARNDVHGNRRQLWVIFSAGGEILDVIRHEDGKGMCSPNQVYPDAVAGPSVVVPVSEFNRWLREMERLKCQTGTGS